MQGRRKKTLLVVMRKTRIPVSRNISIFFTETAVVDTWKRRSCSRKPGLNSHNKQTRDQPSTVVFLSGNKILTALFHVTPLRVLLILSGHDRRQDA